MGQRYNTRLNYQSLHRPTFLPILCSRPSFKDVCVPKSQDPSTRNQEPLSPKISCIGQVKRNNKIIGFPNHTTPNHNKLALTTAKNAGYYDSTVDYFKLKRFFSSRSFTSTATPATTASTCRRRSESVKNCRTRSKTGETSEEKAINIVDLDPPLPVIKKKLEEDRTENLWKRRLGGCELRSLQLRQVQSNQKHQTEPTTV